MTIQDQKDIAEKVYDALTLIDPSCVLAGGAPRDWYLGYEANDLDFYFCSTGCTVAQVKKQLNRVGFEVVASVRPAQSELYASMPGLTRIWDCEFQDMKVQFIQMCDTRHRWEVVNNMDISICKAWYSQKGEVILHKDFKLTFASKVMFLKENYRWSNKHGAKMKDRFKDTFVPGTRDQAEQKLITNALSDL